MSDDDIRLIPLCQRIADSGNQQLRRGSGNDRRVQQHQRIAARKNIKADERPLLIVHHTER
ncbi:hypothetical protein D3C75_1039640 [compost metagenome]